MSFETHWAAITKGRECFSSTDRELASLFYSKGHMDGAREVLAASVKNFEEQIKRNPPQRIDGTVDEYLS